MLPVYFSFVLPNNTTDFLYILTRFIAINPVIFLSIISPSSSIITIALFSFKLFSITNCLHFSTDFFFALSCLVLIDLLILTIAFCNVCISVCGLGLLLLFLGVYSISSSSPISALNKSSFSCRLPYLITAFILLATLNDISVGVKSSSNFASTINSFINSLLIFFNPLSTTYLNSKSFISILSAILPIATKSI